MMNGRVNRENPCKHCGLRITPEGHDPCLGTIPGVMNACCGHGRDEEAYVQFSSKHRLGEEKAVKWFAERGIGCK